MACKVLLVEDDPTVRAVLAVALEIEGYEVKQAACGQAALEHLSRDIPDIIVSDLEMNGMDGRAFCKRTRTIDGLSAIPFVILSAFVEPGAPRALPDLPADCCLSKQTPVAELGRWIDTLIGRGRRGNPAGG